jgi:hypothetical protein
MMRGRRLLQTGIVAGGLLWMHAVAIQDLHAQWLPIGSVSGGTTSSEAIASYQFSAETAGILTVVVRSTDESDLVLMVTDADGQALPDARSDQDLGGDSGAEQFAVTLPRVGTYHVRVEPFSSGVASFRIGASWIGFPDLEQPADPDGTPSTARSITIQQDPIMERLDPSSGDHWDWYALRADRAGMLTVAIRSGDGDLVLEAFNEGAFSESVERSDQDLQEVTGNEALTLSVRPGQTLYFKVSMYGTPDSPIQYRLSVGFMPD